MHVILLYTAIIALRMYNVVEFHIVKFSCTLVKYCSYISFGLKSGHLFPMNDLLTGHFYEPCFLYG